MKPYLPSNNWYYRESKTNMEQDKVKCLVLKANHQLQPSEFRMVIKKLLTPQDPVRVVVVENFLVDHQYNHINQSLEVLGNNKMNSYGHETINADGSVQREEYGINSLEKYHLNDLFSGDTNKLKAYLKEERTHFKKLNEKLKINDQSIDEWLENKLSLLFQVEINIAQIRTSTDINNIPKHFEKFIIELRNLQNQLLHSFTCRDTEPKTKEKGFKMFTSPHFDKVPPIIQQTIFGRNQSDVIKQLGVNIFTKTPNQGGCIQVYDERGSLMEGNEKQCFSSISNGVYSVNVGEAVFIDTMNYHAVTPFKPSIEVNNEKIKQERRAINFFLSPQYNSTQSDIISGIRWN